jgi:hypothetical protein
MNSETVARVLGAIVGAAALVMAFTYAPPGQKPTPATEPPKAQPAAPPAVKGPVVREIPQ